MKIIEKIKEKQVETKVDSDYITTTVTQTIDFGVSIVLPDYIYPLEEYDLTIGDWGKCKFDSECPTGAACLGSWLGIYFVHLDSIVGGENYAPTLDPKDLFQYLAYSSKTSKKLVKLFNKYLPKDNKLSDLSNIPFLNDSFNYTKEELAKLFNSVVRDLGYNIPKSKCLSKPLEDKICF